MKKIFLVTILTILLVSCKQEKKKEAPVTTPTEKEVTVEKTYPKFENAPTQLNIIFDNGYTFADDVIINYIALEHKQGSKYQLIFGLNEDSNIETIEKLLVSTVFYAKDPTKFKDKIYRDRKARQVPSVCKKHIFILDDEKVVAYEFDIIPTEFTQAKFYFYDDSGVLNNKILTINKVNLPK